MDSMQNSLWPCLLTSADNGLYRATATADWSVPRPINLSVRHGQSKSDTSDLFIAHVLFENEM